MLINSIFLILNIIILFFGYIIIKSRIEKKLINKELLNNVKQEINFIIKELNEATLNNISIIEERLKNLDKRIILADKKSAGLDKKTGLFDLKFDKIDKKTYSPNKIINQSKKISENISKKNKNIKDEKKNEFDEIKDLPIIEKVDYLVKKGWDIKKIQNNLNISSGELELILNFSIHNKESKNKKK